MVSAIRWVLWWRAAVVADAIEVLHDEIDEAEEIASRASAIVLRAAERIPELFDRFEGRSLDVLEALAEIVAEDLDGLTTEAVQLGGKAGARRVRELGAVVK